MGCGQRRDRQSATAKITFRPSRAMLSSQLASLAPSRILQSRIPLLAAAHARQTKRNEDSRQEVIDLVSLQTGQVSYLVRPSGRPTRQRLTVRPQAARAVLVPQEPVDRLRGHTQSRGDPRGSPPQLDKLTRRGAPPLSRISKLDGQPRHVSMRRKQRLDRVVLIHFSARPYVREDAQINGPRIPWIPTPPGFFQAALNTLNLPRAIAWLPRRDPLLCRAWH